MLNVLKKRLVTIGLAVSLSVFSVAKADLPNIDDFAYTATLSDATTSLRQFHLPIDAYAKMYRRDNGDLRIFNADGQLVSHQINRARTTTSTQISNLTFYPLDKVQASDKGNISIEINQSTGRQKLKINQSLTPSNTSKIEYQYIIENRHFDTEYNKSASLCKMKLYWQQSEPSLILGLQLESSDDLQNWKSLSRPLNVSRLNYDKSQLVRDEIEFSCTSQSYVRLTWLNQNDSLESKINLTSIQGFYSEKDTPQTKWQSFGKPQYDDDGNWLFESNVVAWLAKMKFVAPQNGLLYKGQLYSRSDSNREWRPRKQVTQYRVALSDSELESNPFSLGAVSDRYWKFEPSIDTKFSDAQLPEIQASWSPNTVLFIAQGNGPFQLALGNPAVAPTSFSDLNTLMRTFKKSGSDIDTVSLSKFVDHGKSFDGQINWKKIALWVVLLLGTLLMAFMAFRLFKQMGEETQKPDAENKESVEPKQGEEKEDQVVDDQVVDDTEKSDEK